MWKWSWKIADLVMESHGKVMEFRCQDFVGALDHVNEVNGTCGQDETLFELMSLYFIYKKTAWKLSKQQIIVFHYHSVKILSLGEVAFGQLCKTFFTSVANFGK